MFRTKANRTIIAALAVLIVLGWTGKKMGWWGQPELKKVTVEKVKLRTIVETVSASGKIQPELEVKISPDVSGEIIELNVKEGQEVKKGDLLCKIKPDLYEAAVNRSNASLNTSKANLASAKARLLQVQANFENIKSLFERNKKLFDQGAISHQEWDASVAQYQSALADVKAAEENVRASEFTVNSAEASLKESLDNLKRTAIYSPIDGIISKLNIELGERVVGTSQMAGTEIMRIANLNNMEVNVEVNENDIIRVNLHDTAEIEVDAYLNRKFKGVVTEIANSANVVGANTDQVTNFSVKVKILRESYSDLLVGKPKTYSPFRPGMSATVEIKTKTVKNAVSVPISAVTTRSSENEKSSDLEKSEDQKSFGTQEYVFVLNNNRVKLTKVKTGIQDNDYIQILDGLSPGLEVVSGPYAAVSKDLSDGMQVEVIPKNESPK